MHGEIMQFLVIAYIVLIILGVAALLYWFFGQVQQVRYCNQLNELPFNFSGKIKNFSIGGIGSSFYGTYKNYQFGVYLALKRRLRPSLGLDDYTCLVVYLENKNRFTLKMWEKPFRWGLWKWLGKLPFYQIFDNAHYLFLTNNIVSAKRCLDNSQAVSAIDKIFYIGGIYNVSITRKKILIRRYVYNLDFTKIVKESLDALTELAPHL